MATKGGGLPGPGNFQVALAAAVTRSESTPTTPAKYVPISPTGSETLTSLTPKLTHGVAGMRLMSAAVRDSGSGSLQSLTQSMAEKAMVVF